MKYFYLAASSIILAYIGITIFIYFYQRNLLYHPSENNYLNDKVSFEYEELFINTDENISLKSWFIKKDLKNFVIIHVGDDLSTVSLYEDASLVFFPESSAALGFGLRCGFLGMLHLEIIQERLDREFNMAVITTVPNVSYHAYTKKQSDEKIIVNTPSDLPEPSFLDRVEEPYIKASIITKSDFVGPVMNLCIEKRGEITNQTYLTTERVELSFDMPLAEIVFDFYDRLKSISKGYASFDYSPLGFKKSKLIRLDLLLNGNPVDALSALIHFDNAYRMGKKICEKLKELIPRQQFDIPVQAAIGSKIIARETIKAVRKDVTAKCYGGDITRKRKLLENQKKGKKKMRQIGNVEIPQQAFMAVLKLND